MVNTRHGKILHSLHWLYKTIHDKILDLDQILNKLRDTVWGNSDLWGEAIKLINSCTKKTIKICRPICPFNNQIYYNKKGKDPVSFPCC